MKKLYFGLFIAIFILSAFPARAQVFAYPGATWMFSHPFIGLCYEHHERWEYTGDTVIAGDSAKIVLRTLKVLYPPVPYTVVTYPLYKYFRVIGDTVCIWQSSDSSWFELYNFSLSIGDATHSPLLNSFGFGFNCNDSIPYKIPAVVVDTGTANISGSMLRYYTVKYYSGLDTTQAFQTYYERIIMLNYNYWYPDDWYWCNGASECNNPDCVCYMDQGMLTNSLCYNQDWFETLDIKDNLYSNDVSIYPNPVHDILSIQNPHAENYQILSYDGKLVGRYTGNSINVSQLSSGLYFITNESRTWFKKFIKD